MTDLVEKQTVLKLEALKAAICALFANYSQDDYFTIIKKLEQMEKLIVNLPKAAEITVFWQQKLINFWKAISAEGSSIVEHQSRDEKDDNLLPVASENSVEPAPETVNVNSLDETYSQLTIHSPSTDDNEKSEPFSNPKRHLVSKQTLEFITGYIKKNPQESIKEDVYQIPATSKEEDQIISKTQKELTFLLSIKGPYDIEAMKKLYLFTERVRHVEPSAMFTQHSASIFSAAFQKLSLDQQESYSQLNYSQDATRNNYRAWFNLATFLKQQMIEYFTKQLLATTGSSFAKHNTCNYCKKDGHFLVQCPSRRSNLCINCFTYGHSQTYCQRFGVSE